MEVTEKGAVLTVDGARGYFPEALIVTAIEKQIPKKVKGYTGKPCSVKAFDGACKVETFLCYPCSVCGKWIHANENNKYCPHCGQALDWSAE